MFPSLSRRCEHLGGTLQQRGLSLRNLVRVEIKPFGQLHQLVVAFHGAANATFALNVAD
ncbi:MAG: hypothetical protein OEW98_05140 [Betaproteobacteria bacterium]|jgi:hypothetical protein|nr:hypothetical protein [Betaproteobacteria bacterium]